MSYTPEVVATARTVARLLDDQPCVTRDDLPIALHAHSATIDLVDDILTGHQELKRRPSLRRESREADPVGSLARDVRSHPRHDSPASMTDLMLATRPRTERAALWVALARHAEAASMHWQEDVIRPRQDPNQAWSTTADAAALADGLARLDHHLADALRSTGDTASADRYARATTMTAAALATVELARVGPLADVAGLQRARPHQVTSAPDVLRSQLTTARLLRESESLRPTDVVRTASAQIQLATRLAVRLARTDPDVALTLTHYAEHLDPLISAGQSVRSVRAGSTAPATQGRLTWERVIRLERRADLLAAGLSFLGGARDVTAALDDAVSRHEGGGHWLHPAERHDRLRWERRFLAHSQLAEAVRQAAGWARSERRLEPMEGRPDGTARDLLIPRDTGRRRPILPPIDLRAGRASPPRSSRPRAPRQSHQPVDRGPDGRFLPRR